MLPISKIILVLTTSILLTSCASSPKGENVLMNGLNKNSVKHDVPQGLPTIKQGPPIFIKAYSYSQVLNTGDIWGGGNIFIEAGREKIDLNKIISNLK